MGQLLEELLETMEEGDAAAWRQDSVRDRVREMDAVLLLVPQLEAGLATLQELRAMAQVHVEMQTAMSRITSTHGHANMTAHADAMQRLLHCSIARESHHLALLLSRLVPIPPTDDSTNDEQRRQRRTPSINWDLE